MSLRLATLKSFLNPKFYTFSMPKIDVVLTKEGLDPSRHPDAVAVVLDIIFATTSMSAAFASGISSLIPAVDFEEAKTIGAALTDEDWMLAGEDNARAFSGHLSYEPLALQTPALKNKTLIHATTNGTVALKNAGAFHTTYAASLLNGAATAAHLLQHKQADQDIIIVCAGSKGWFGLEDFYGAGHLIHHLQRLRSRAYQLSDTAQAAIATYRQLPPYDTLLSSRLGQFMLARGFGKSLEYCAQLDCFDAVLVYQQGRVRQASA